jgi:hypothetical protein
VSVPTPEAGALSADPVKPEHHRIRHTIGIICLVISCVLAPLAVISNFVKMELLNTDRYVSTVKPLVHNQAVTDYVATRATQQLISSVNVRDVVEQALPPRAQLLAAPIVAGIQTVVEDVTKRILSSDQFAAIWVRANRNAHEQVKEALTGDGKAVRLEHGKVILVLDDLIAQVRQDLDQRGITIFDNLPKASTGIRLELFDAQGLEEARTYVRLLVVVRVVLIALVFALAGLGIYLARDRRRALAGWGLGIAISLGIIAGMVLLARTYALDHLSDNGVPRAASQGVIDAALYYLRLAFRAGIALGLVVAVAATLSGPSPPARRVRAFLRAGIDRTPAPEPGPVPRWVASHKTLLRVAGVVVALLGLLAWSTPGAITVLAFTLLLLLWLAAIEIVGRGAAETPPAAPA